MSTVLYWLFYGLAVFILIRLCRAVWIKLRDEFRERRFRQKEARQKLILEKLAKN
jgi:hypothetical protein